MKVTIVAEDNMVLINGFPETVDLSALDDDIHAVQWYGTVGEVEYKMDYVNNTRKGNERITDLTPFAWVIGAWEAAAQA